MKEWISPQMDPPVAVAIRRRQNARRLSLRVSRVDGKATLTAPPWVPDHDIRRFLSEQGRWLAENCAALPGPIDVTSGAVIPFRGQEVTILRTDKTRGAARLHDGVLAVPGAPEDLPRRVGAFLKLAAREQLASECDGFVRNLPGRAYTRLTLRDTRSRWGSCSGEGALMFSWRLIMAPPDVLSYVAAHEVAHLAEMNHSPAFWGVVRGLMPDYETPLGWLRKSGTELHRWRFGT